MFITDEEIDETYTRIIRKFGSVNYQPGFTVPKSLAPWYVIITELRLLCISPLVIIVEREKGEPYHNIIEDEFKKSITPSFLKDDFFPCPKQDEEVKVVMLPDYCLGYKQIAPHEDNWKVFRVRYGTPKNGTKQDESLKFDDLEPRSWRAISTTEPKWRNSNLDRIDSAIVFCLQNWCVWVFGNSKCYSLGTLHGKEYSIPPNITKEQFQDKKGICVLGHLAKRLTQILQREEIHPSCETEIEPKDLFPICKYKLYHEEVSTLKLELSLEIFDNDQLEKNLSKGLDDALKYVMDRLQEVAGIEIKRESLRAYFLGKNPRRRRLLRKVNVTDFKKRLKLFLIQDDRISKELLKHKNLPLFLYGCRNAPYFNVLESFFGKVYTTICSNLEHILKPDLRFDILFNAFGKDFKRTLIVPEEWLKRWREKNLDAGALKEPYLPEDFYVNIWRHFYSIMWSFKYRVGEIRGLAGYVDMTNHPEFALMIHPDFKEKNDRRMAIPNYKEFFPLLNLHPKSPVNVVQIPCVFTRFDEKNGKDVLKLIEEKIIEPGGYLYDERIQKSLHKELQRIRIGLDKVDKDPIGLDKQERQSLINSIDKLKAKIKRKPDDEKREEYKNELEELIRMLEFLNKLLCGGVNFSLYNFSVNSQDSETDETVFLQNLRSLWRATFDQAFDLLYAAGFIQKEQNELFKAHLFEEATNSFKKALEFPLLTPDSETSAEEK